MGIFSKLKGEFIDIIQWLDETPDTVIHRFERYNNQIKNGAQLTVRESQIAVLVNEGQLADVFRPGRYELSTKNVPILSTLKGWKYGFNSPFVAEVYFATTRNFVDLKWGTKNPVMMRDPEFGPIRLRAFGTYAFRVRDPEQVIRAVAGTSGNYTVDDIQDQLKNLIITRFTDAIGTSKIPALDLAASYDELSSEVHDKISGEYDELGFELTKFLIENISLPPAVEEAIDKRSSMGVIGNLNNYMQFQAANSLESAAKNPGGTAAGGMGMGMGFAMANQMAGMFNPQQQQMQQQQMQQPMQQQHAAPPPPPPPVPGVSFFAVVNGAQGGPFNLATLKQMVQKHSLNKETLVWKQGMAAWTKAGQVPELAGLWAAPGPPPVPPM